MRWLPRSLRARSALVAGTVATVTFALGSGWLLSVLHDQAYAATGELAQQQSREMSSLLVEGVSFGGDFGPLPYEITDGQGELLSSSAVLESVESGGPALGSLGSRRVEGLDIREDITLPAAAAGPLAGLDTQMIVAVVRANQLGDPADPSTNQLRRVAVLITPETANQAIHTALPFVLTGLLTFTALAAGAAAWATRGSLQAVEQLRRTAQQLADGPPGRRELPAVIADPEITALADTFNTALRRQDQAIDRERRFLADAAHELRNPLASVIVNLDMAATFTSAEDRHEAVKAAARAGHRLQSVTEDLLLLASVSAAAVPAQTIDLTALAHRETHRDGVPVTGPTGPAVWVVARPAHLRRAIANLVDNAQRHAHTIVTIAVGADTGSVWLDVTDDGDGVDPADRHRIFTPFVRLDDSRSRDDGGTGLGLAIVHDVAAAHRGTIQVLDTPTGTTFRLQLPVHGPSTDCVARH